MTPGRQKALAAIFMDAERGWYRSELARHLDVPPSSLQGALASLADSGLLVTRHDGNRLYYRANRENPLFLDIQAMLIKTVGLLDVLKVALKPHAWRIELAFVYGSIARGEATAASDVDVLGGGDAGLSDDGKFDRAYGAARTRAAMIIRAEDCRVKAAAGSHRATFFALKAAVSEAFGAFAEYFDRCRAKRNRAGYEVAGMVSSVEAQELTGRAEDFAQLAQGWIAKRHPSLA